MTRKKTAIIAASCVGIFLVAALTTGAVYKMNKAAEYEVYLTQQAQLQQMQEEDAKRKAEALAATSKWEPEPIKSIDEQKKDNKIAAEAAREEAGLAPASSVPEVTVSTDEKGNQTITPDWEEPEKPKHENIHDPDSAPETPSRPGGGTVDDQIKDEGVEFDKDGNQKPNANGEIYVPGFGWQKPTGASYDTAPNAGKGEKIGQ